MEPVKYHQLGKDDDDRWFVQEPDGRRVHYVSYDAAAIAFGKTPVKPEEQKTMLERCASLDAALHADLDAGPAARQESKSKMKWDDVKMWFSAKPKYGLDVEAMASRYTNMIMGKIVRKTSAKQRAIIEAHIREAIREATGGK